MNEFSRVIESDLMKQNNWSFFFLKIHPFISGDSKKLISFLRSVYINFFFFFLIRQRPMIRRVSQRRNIFSCRTFLFFFRCYCWCLEFFLSSQLGGHTRRIVSPWKLTEAWLIINFVLFGRRFVTFFLPPMHIDTFSLVFFCHFLLNSLRKIDRC